MSISSFADLRLPPVMKTLAWVRPGLLLSTGLIGDNDRRREIDDGSGSAAGDGAQEHLHIVTVEDPSEDHCSATSPEGALR